MFFVFYLNINCLRNKFFQLNLIIFYIFIYFYKFIKKDIKQKWHKTKIENQ